MTAAYHHMFNLSWYDVKRPHATMQAADDREAELRRSLRDTELKHKQQVKHLDASVQELQRYDHLAKYMFHPGIY